MLLAPVARQQFQASIGRVYAKVVALAGGGGRGPPPPPWLPVDDSAEALLPDSAEARLVTRDASGPLVLASETPLDRACDRLDRDADRGASELLLKVGADGEADAGWLAGGADGPDAAEGAPVGEARALDELDDDDPEDEPAGAAPARTGGELDAEAEPLADDEVLDEAAALDELDDDNSSADSAASDEAALPDRDAARLDRDCAREPLTLLSDAPLLNACEMLVKDAEIVASELLLDDDEDDEEEELDDDDDEDDEDDDGLDDAEPDAELLDDEEELPCGQQAKAKILLPLTRRLPCGMAVTRQPSRYQPSKHPANARTGCP